MFCGRLRMRVCDHESFIKHYEHCTYRKGVSVKIINQSFLINISPTQSGGTGSPLHCDMELSPYLWVRNEPKNRIWIIAAILSLNMASSTVIVGLKANSTVTSLISEQKQPSSFSTPQATLSFLIFGNISAGIRFSPNWVLPYGISPMFLFYGTEGTLCKNQVLISYKELSCPEGIS